MSPMVVLVILQDWYFDTVLGGVHHISYEIGLLSNFKTGKT
jgi:hypothetical protein